MFGNFARAKMAVVMIWLTTPILSGCGTISNLEGSRGFLMKGPPDREPRPFGGVIQDSEFLLRPVMAKDLSMGERILIAPICSLFLLDIPFSVVGDMATLPMIGAAQREFKHAQENAIPLPTLGNTTYQPPNSDTNGAVR
ncbi:MAG: hypothetical protein HY040_00730 [Planctomycetes bacterium]|nr:hypothetical protein [Planctomycetota bacterium]